MLGNPQNLDGDIETPSIGSSATGRVYDDEPAALLGVSAGSTQVFEGSAASTSVTFTITRTVQPGGSIDYASTVAWQIVGNNINWGGNNGGQVSGYGGNTVWSSSPYYNTTYGVVSFAAGETSKQVTVTFGGDTVIEPDTGLTMTLLDPRTAYDNGFISGSYRDEYGPTNIDPAQASASTTLRNDDIRLWMGSFGNTTPSVAGYEGQPLNFTLVRSGRLDNDITLNYTLTNGNTNSADFVSTSGTITLAGGQSSYAISLANLLKLDGSIESTEGFTLNLSAPGDTTGSTVRFGVDSIAASTATSMSVGGTLYDGDTAYSITPPPPAWRKPAPASPRPSR